MASPLLACATIGKTYGVDGFVRIYSLSGEKRHLLKLKSCIVRTRGGEELSLSIEKVEEKGDLLLMKFSLYPTPEKARFLSQSTIFIPRENSEKLLDGEFYVADFYSMDVMYSGKKVGSVEYTMEGAQALLLSVRRNDNGKEYIVPYLPVYVGKVSVEDNTLELLYPALLDL